MSADALYLHIPFCKRKCAYCDFVSFATECTDPLMSAYTDALRLQIEQAASCGLLDAARTAYIGGGTPSYAGRGLIALVDAVSAIGPLEELTVEANPDSASPDLLTELRDAGATRISLGIQSLSDEELTALVRIHDAAAARAALIRAVGLGFDVSADLMCAIPFQTSDSWQTTLEGVVSAGVCHVSVYPLMIEDGTPFAQAVERGEMPVPDDSDEAARMEEAERFLSDHGFARYEVASYARPGRTCIHNRAYWTGVPYLGLGTGASSMFNRDGFEQLLGLMPQLGSIPDDASRVRFTYTTDRRALAGEPALASQSFDVEFLTEREALAEDLMLGARMACGLDARLVSRARTVMGAELDDCLAGLIDDGFLDADLAPTHKGWLLGNELYGRLWELAGTR